VGEDKDPGNAANPAEVKSTEIWNTKANRNMRKYIQDNSIPNTQYHRGVGLE